jgi:D-glycero-D-manno-heptose 1,7-bisphosphate phosphatase
MSDRAVFFDRDGVLNDLVVRDGVGVSPRRLDDFRLRADAATAAERLRRLGLQLFVTSNQPDIARGLMRREDLDAMTRIVQTALPVQEVLVCPHDDGDGCACRKPKPGMLLELAERWRVNLRASFLVGDSWKDIEAGRRAGCVTILVGPDAVDGANAIVPDLSAAADKIEAYL